MSEPNRFLRLLLQFLANLSHEIRTPMAGGPEPCEPVRDDLSERLASLRALEEKTGKPVVAVFLQQSDKDLAAVRRELSKEDGKTVAEAAHALAGSAGMLGAKALSETASEIAVLALQGDLSGCAARLPALEQAWRETAGRLRRLALRRKHGL